MPIELVTVGLAGVLVIVQLLLAAGPRVRASGTGWALGPRDEAPRPVSLRGQRAERAYRNMLETFPVFAAGAIAVVAADATSAATAAGSQLYFWARVAYVPAYVFHVPLVRPAVWGIALLGILLVLSPLLFGTSG